MVGGLDLSGDIPLPVGTFVSANLTPAGPLKDWSDGEIMRALREGVGNKGQRLMVMQSTYVRYLSDEDIHALIAYLRSQPAVESNVQEPLDQPNMLGVVLLGSGIIPELAPVKEAIVAPPKGATVEYGQYILSYQDCRSCHGNDLNGGDGTLGPAGPPLSVVKGWSQEEFLGAMRTGITPAGRALQPPMPWKTISKMEDEELQAMYLYLKEQW
jgi:mono/diheme cytochrome c family protein